MALPDWTEGAGLHPWLKRQENKQGRVELLSAPINGTAAQGGVLMIFYRGYW